MKFKEAIRAKLEQARAIAKTAEDGNRPLTETESAQITALFADAKALKDQGDEQDNITSQIKDLFGDDVADPTKHNDAPRASGKGSIGEQFIKSDPYTGLIKNYGQNGKISDEARFGQTAPMEIGGSKAIITGLADNSAGALIYPDYRPIEDPSQLFRNLSIYDLCAKGSTSSDTIQYPRVVSYTNNAAPVPEAAGNEPFVTGAGQVQGIKPQSSMILETVSTTVKTIAHWLPVTKRALSDAPYIRTLIDNFLRYGLAEEVEDQILNGNGAGENFDGIFHLSGTTPQAFTTDLLTTTRQAKRKVRTVGRGVPTAFVFSEEDNEKLDLLRDGNGGTANSGAFLFGGPAQVGVQTLWGLPRIASEALSPGQFICADWRYIEYVDREQASIQVAEQHADFFIRNLAAVLAELRAALLFHRPKSIVIGATAA